MRNSPIFARLRQEWGKKWVTMDISQKSSASRLSPEILKLIADIDEFKGRGRRWRSSPRMATIEGVGSSARIEGARLSDRELETLLSGMRAKSFASRDAQEAAGLRRLLKNSGKDQKRRVLQKGA